MRWEAWPALVAAVAWALFLGSVLATYDPATPLEWLSLVILTGVPLALCVRQLVVDWRNAEWSGLFPRAPAPVSAAWRRGVIVAVGLALLVAAVCIDLLTRPSSFEVQWFDDNLPLTVTHLRPGTGEAWAYLVALALTLALVANPTRRLARPLLLSSASLGAAVVFGGMLLFAAGGSRVDAAGTGGPTSCQRPGIGVGVPPRFDGVVVSHAAGELDGQPLGTVDIRPRSVGTGVDAHVTAIFDTVWGRGTAKLDFNQLLMTAPDPLGLSNLSLWIFHGDETIVADDLGIDLIGGTPHRHCSLIIDGRTAVNGFEALRWLTGTQASFDPGAGLEAWRGTVDYWIQPVAGATDAEIGFRGLGLASVTIDGQPPAWPVTGLRASLNAWTWFPPADR